MMFWYGSGGWVWWQAALMWLAMIVFWGALIFLVYALVTGITRRDNERQRGGQDGQDQQPRKALQILDERLARGEIEPEEYWRRREILEGGTEHSRAGAGGKR